MKYKKFGAWATILTRSLGRLSVGRKLMLIYLLDLCSVFYVAGILINEKYLAIDFARKELDGSAYAAVVSSTLLELARTPVLSGAWVEGGMRHGFVETQRRLRDAQAQHGEGVLAAETSQRYLQALEAGAATAMPEGLALLTRVVNQSNLILDPDLDSYYTMSVAMLRLPELLDVVHGLNRTLARDLGQESDRAAYLVLEGRLDAVTRGLASDFHEAYASGDPALRAALEPGEQGLLAAVERYRQQASRAAQARPSPEQRLALQQSQLALLDTLQQDWERVTLELNRLLRQRIDHQYTRMGVHLGTALFLMLAILAIVSFVARQIATPLSRLATVADHVRDSGDLRLTVDWHSRDEIGRLVDAFHDMLGQLDAEREQRQELIARERAAQAQRSLLESMPAPLMVTAVPGHEVLHANGPAQQWLAGCTRDPWARALTSSVRARFFQQLADRDAVDEFEVHWALPREPIWAVLAARRIQFQGQDAVLTVLSPIHRLKLMEQRLELWAKVFENSSEGIFIVGADRRLLTVNHALLRSSGHELEALVGQAPMLLLAGSDVTTQWQDIEQGLRRRGSWQGELRMRRRNGSDYPAWLLVSVVRDSAGRTSHLVCTSIDISDRKASEQRIRFLAEHDVLTELPNRALCQERLRLAMQLALRHDRRVAVLFIDLDRFKTINDTLGHHMGDGLLRSVAQRLTSVVRDGDTVSRLGGDEFVIVLGQVQNVDEVAHLVEERLIPLIRSPHEVQGTELHVSCSVGIAVYPDDAQHLEELMRLADLAMYQAKSEGRNSARFFTPEMNARARERLRVETLLRHAVEQGELELYFQPRIDLARGEVARFEALLRWNSPELGRVEPDRFIPVAEDIGLIAHIGVWVIEAASAQLALWRSQGHPALGVSVNVSTLQLRDPGLLQALERCLAQHQLPAGALELELTESVLMDQAEAHLEALTAIRALGVRLSIDDFGTGYSSLSYLNRFPIDELKIDRSFVHGVHGQGHDLAIIRAIVSLARTLGLRVVAEGVETQQDVQVLQQAGCDELQGFFFARPMPAEQVGRWLRDRLLQAPGLLSSAMTG